MPIRRIVHATQQPPSGRPQSNQQEIYQCQFQRCQSPSLLTQISTQLPIYEVYTPFASAPELCFKEREQIS